jgi:predicted metalloprotease with PDZ domain
MKYIFSHSLPFERFVSIELHLDNPGRENTLDLQLPAWRPGRYELGNFAKNIKGFEVINEQGDPLTFHKVTKDRWQIETNKSENLIVRYRYFASQPDAGACWIDPECIYINPVHCCFYIPGRENEKVEVHLHVPENWQCATGMNKTDNHHLWVSSSEVLFDSPFITSPSLQHASFTMDGIPFNIWINGVCKPDWNRIVKDFEGFTRVQLDMMGAFPASDFHYLILVLPFKFYHGVEHTNSTVLALGPGSELMKNELYNDLLGVASHELFHCWNVKTIRPAEMQPYDFTKENYATTGYVYEGVTTYYGDLFLGRSGFFTLQQMLDEFSVRLQKHMDNPGRFNYSVAESSFDTWLDGYVPGVPGRKTSIYDEGCLLALILDFMIRSATDSIKSLDDVIIRLNEEYGKKRIGYTRADYQRLAEDTAGRGFADFFEKYVYKASSLDSFLSEVLSLAGLKIEEIPAASYTQRVWGIKTESKSGQEMVTTVYPGSPAADCGLVKEDEILAVEGMRISQNLNSVAALFDDRKEMELLVASAGFVSKRKIKKVNRNFYSSYKITAADPVTHAQLMFRQAWLKTGD